MAIRTDLAPEYADPENQTWKALWNEKYSGRLSMSNVSYEAFAIAALILGIDPWHMDEADRIQCEDLLRKQIPLNRTLGASFTERVQAMASGRRSPGCGVKHDRWAGSFFVKDSVAHTV
jgi:spermidine/putrescine transport system substrate-binding protein